MSPVSSDPHSCLSAARGVFHTRAPPLSFLQNLRPSLPLSSCAPPPPSSLGRGLCPGAGMGIWHRVLRVLQKSYRLRTSPEMEGRDPVPTQPALPHTHPVPGSAWACLASLHTSRSTAQTAWPGGIGEEAPEGSTREPGPGRGSVGDTLGSVMSCVSALSPGDGVPAAFGGGEPQLSRLWPRGRK